jgi:DNA-binding response OmpR family regulator
MTSDHTQSILVVEDQSDISELIKLQLEISQYKVSCAKNLAEANSLLEKNSFDLCLIDRMLPDGLGIDLCKSLRNNPNTSLMPLIFITALSEPENIVEGLDAGANDYITKPFDLSILLARVRAQLRTNKQKSNRHLIEIHNIQIDDTKKRVYIGKELINLTLTEYNILKFLTSEAGAVHTRRTLISKILGDDIFVTDRIIDTHIVGLRKKIKDEAKWIETIRGVGYRFKEDE